MYKSQSAQILFSDLTFQGRQSQKRKLHLGTDPRDSLDYGDRLDSSRPSYKNKNFLDVI